MPKRTTVSSAILAKKIKAESLAQKMRAKSAPEIFSQTKKEFEDTELIGTLAKMIEAYIKRLFIENKIKKVYIDRNAMPKDFAYAKVVFRGTIGKKTKGLQTQFNIVAVRTESKSIYIFLTQRID